MFNIEFNLDFYKGKKVLITGHTGFKGSWLSQMLKMAGAEVTGYSLEPKDEPTLFKIAKIENGLNSVIGDVRDLDYLTRIINENQPEFVFHLAAQPIVRESYTNPVYTYETNVMGTVNILEAIRNCKSVKSFLNVTTDKVYMNKEWEWGYRENEMLDGFDPYSNSKSCSELVTHCYRNALLKDQEISISTARAGNVIGGGDFSKDRILPDCIRAAAGGEKIVVRNPYSIRPYQHVLESLFAYLMIAAKQFEDQKFSGYYNIGPDESDCYSTRELVELFINKWGEDSDWIYERNEGPHEANFLKLDCSKLKNRFNWKPRWNIETAVEKTVEWTKCWLNKNDINKCMEDQISIFLDNGTSERG